MNTMNHGFKTEEMVVVVESRTYANSAFGVNAQGEAVFFNTRIVEAINLEEGDSVTAHCIPNYPDKQDQVPWRCIRAEIIEDVPVEEELPMSVKRRIQHLLADPNAGYLTTKEIADEIEKDTVTTSGILNSMFRQGGLVKADVYASPDQRRVSLALWASSVDAFR